ncbi:MAG: three-Cys-motif partner protein TcmP [Candidatus Puniceispirillaceae bacterium]
MADNSFFEHMDERSRAKATIVAKYFASWANVIIHANARRVEKIAYIDLFAGPGRYKDGSASTPLLVLQTAINNPKIAQKLQGYFNDYNKDNSETLRSEIEKLKDISKLKFPPIINCKEIGKDVAKELGEASLVPSFTFIDPWGYKGFSLGLLQAVIKDWGCDCVFFFNYNRINPGISNSNVIRHMNALFGQEIANGLREKLNTKINVDRQTLILDALIQAIRSEGGKYVLPFRFLKENRQPNHFLIFVSKHFKGYEIMKEIMAKESSTEDQGVASFAYSPADKSSPLLFSLQSSLEDLSGMLIKTFSGQKFPVAKIYRDHNVDTPFTKKNYKTVLLQMESDGLVAVSTAPGKKRKAGTMADHLIIEFPEHHHGS